MVWGRVRSTFTPLTGNGRGFLILTVGLGWFFTLGMRFVIPGILPSITTEFSATDAEAGLAMTALWAAYAIMQFPAGYYGDRLSERVLLVTSLSIGGGALAAYFLTPTFGLFVLVTTLFGLGTGLYGPSRGTLLSKSYDTHDSAAFGAVLAAGSIGAAVLPAVAALIVAVVGWRMTLGGAAPAFFAVAVGIWWAVPDTRIAAPETGSTWELLRSAGAVMRTRRVAIAVVGLTLMLFVFQAITAFLTTYLIDVKGFSQAAAGSVLGILFVVGAVSQILCGRLGDVIGKPRMLVAISVASVLPLAALPLVEGFLPVAIVSALIGVRIGINPVSNAYILDLIPDPIEGTAWGVVRTGFFLVSALGSTVVGQFADAGLFDLSLYVLAALSALGAGVYLLLPDQAWH